MSDEAELARLQKALARAEKRCEQLERRAVTLDRVQAVNAVVQGNLLRDIERARAQLEARRRDVEADLAQARAFQRALLPAPPPQRRFRIAAWDEPAEVVGGDLYDFEPRPDGVRLLLCDATGHGIQASLRTMVVRASLDRLRGERGGPEVFLARLSQALVERFGPNEVRLAALCLDLSETADGLIAESAQAGAPGWWLAGATRSEEVYLPGPFVGMLADARFARCTRRVAPGDRLLLASDGLFEQPGGGGARLPEGTLLAALRSGRTPEDALDALRRALAEHRGARPQEDDVAVIVVEVA